MGNSLMMQWIKSPLQNSALIEQRLSAVEAFCSAIRRDLSTTMSNELRKINNIHPLLMKLSDNKKTPTLTGNLMSL